MANDALTSADLAHALRRIFRRRIDDARRSIELAMEKGTIGVSFSAGKDSTVLLDLVRQYLPDVPAAHFDSGAEHSWTYDLVRHYGVQTIMPQLSMIDLAKLEGAWGYSGPESGHRVDYDDFLIYEPAERFMAEHSLQVIALGLRGQESKGRYWSARKRGALYWANYTSAWHLCPLATWTTDDVWAYIASRGLRYNEAYDRMAACGIPRDAWRVSTLLSYEGAAKRGRFTYLRQIDPQRFYTLAEIFPAILSYT